MQTLNARNLCRVARRFYHAPVPKEIKNSHLWEHRGIVPLLIKYVHNNFVSCLGFINGQFTRGNSFRGDTFEVKNPANGAVIAVLPRMVASDVDEAASAAKKAWPAWRNSTAKDRAKILNNMAALMIKYEDDLASIITLEAGKPFPEAKVEVAYSRSFLEFYAEEATRCGGEILQTPIKGQLEDHKGLAFAYLGRYNN
jgi:acyl-CoA reductase-like NAD-dependent aldehyde dehydrogenase